MEINSIKIRIHLPKNILRLTFIITYLFCITSFPQIKEPRFEHLGVKDGLPVNTITTMLQDNLGYLWFGTDFGLAKYDGYKFVNYYYDKDNPKSLSDDYIQVIYEDRHKNLWIGTQPISDPFYTKSDYGGGLNLFDRKTESFKRFLNNPNDTSTLNSNFIKCIVDDDEDNLWLGTNNGLNLFDQKSKKFRRIKFIDYSLTDEAYSFLNFLDNNNFVLRSVNRVKNKSSFKKEIRIKRKSIVMTVITGEAKADYGWVEDSRGNAIIKSEYKSSYHAGGRFDNRIEIIIDTLEAGIYFLNYLSDNSHAYGNWRGEPPRESDRWGIQFYLLNDSLLNVYNNLKTIRQTEIDQVVVESLLQDRITKRIYIATNYGMFSEIPSDLKKSNSILVNKVIDLGFLSHLIQTSDGTLWVCSQNGLYSFDTIKNRVNFHLTLPTSNQRIPVTGKPFFEDKDGTLWIAGTGEGIIRFDKDLKKYDMIKYNPDDKYSINDNLIQSVIEDRSGVVWCGSNKWDRKKWKFNSIEYLQKSKSGLINPNVFSLAIDKRDRLWIGSISGLQILNLKDHKFYNLENDFSVLKIFDGKEIWDIVPDGFDENIVWISCGMTIYKYNLKDNKLFSYPADLKTNYVYTINNIIQLLPFNQNYLIAATSEGLLKLDKNTNQLYSYKKDPGNEQSLSDDFTISLYKTKSNELWIGTKVGGLDRFDPETNTIDRIFSLRNNNRPNPIYQIIEDDNGNLWLGTYRDGLYKFDIGKKSTKRFTVENGLPENGIMIIQKDKTENLWLGTLNGLSKFNPKKSVFNNFFIEDGLPNNFFISGASAKNSNGTLFMGTRGGIVYFHPDSIVIDSIPPQVVIQNISLFNRPDEKLEYEGFISEIDEVTLPYNQNDLHFEYVGLHYGEPQRNKYKYILEGFDKDWIDAGNSRTATYTNLDPGEYKFRVKACNRDGIWNEAGASLKIIINPPLWATTWAYLFYIILFGSIIYYTWRMQLKRVRVKHEFEMSKFEAQKLHEVDELKSHFFANISHEFRTPLTLILGPVKQMIEKLDEGKMKDNLSIVHRNANRLLGLVNQLLDISKIESGSMKLQTTPINIIPYLKALVLSFTSYAERKRISLNFVSDVDEIIVYIDKDKFEKIINNVLSNAFKFTPDDGGIEVIVNQDNKNLEITIADTGVGIPKEKMQKIFDRFYQVDGSHTREQEGTGIGLSLTKELVELHKGKIEVESEEGKGSSFIISIPLGTNHLKPEEIGEAETHKIESLQFENTLANTPVNKINGVDTDLITQIDKPLLLIVEDNYDVRNYIRSNLDNGYRIMEAVDGEDGWNKSVERIPDLIISDVMMPKMDGFELCKRLKIDERTSHIPVILLTAKAAKQDKLEGYEIGADEYIMKPFEPDELSARIKNLIVQREKLQEHFKKKGMLGFAQSQITSVDKNFLQKVLDKIDQHISDSSFSVELLADDLGISRSVVHRKILSLTGETPGELIRRIRLNKAAALIKSKFGNLSEIALEVGFNNPAHFSESFKKQFGVSPSHYQ